MLSENDKTYVGVIFNDIRTCVRGSSEDSFSQKLLNKMFTVEQNSSKRQSIGERNVGRPNPFIFFLVADSHQAIYRSVWVQPEREQIITRTQCCFIKLDSCTSTYPLALIHLISLQPVFPSSFNDDRRSSSVVAKSHIADPAGITSARSSFLAILHMDKLHLKSNP